jgi:hypothetical protein
VLLLCDREKLCRWQDIVLLWKSQSDFDVVRTVCSRGVVPVSWFQGYTSLLPKPNVCHVNLQLGNHSSPQCKCIWISTIKETIFCRLSSKLNTPLVMLLVILSILLWQFFFFFLLIVGQITLSLRTTECLANTVCRIVDSHDCPCLFSFCTNTLACPKSCCFYVDSLYSASGFGLLAMWTSLLNCAGSCVPEYQQIKPIGVGWFCCCCAYGYYWNHFCL